MAHKTQKIKIMAALALVFIAVILVLTDVLWAKDASKDFPAMTTAEAQASWVVRCDDIKNGEQVTGKYCEMVQSISVTQKDADPSTAQRLVELAIGYPPAGEGKASAVIVLPLGVLVNEDVVLEIDGKKEKTIRVRYCDVAGCFAAFDLSEKEMGKLSKGKAMVVKATAATGQPISIELSLTGFGDAYGKIKPAKTGGMFF